MVKSNKSKARSAQRSEIEIPQFKCETPFAWRDSPTGPARITLDETNIKSSGPKMLTAVMALKDCFFEFGERVVIKRLRLVPPKAHMS